MSELEELKQENQELKTERKQVVSAILGITNLIGLTENGALKPQFKGGEAANPLPTIIKSLTDIGTLSMLSKSPGRLGKKYQAQLEEKVGYVESGEEVINQKQEEINTISKKEILDQAIEDDLDPAKVHAM